MSMRFFKRRATLFPFFVIIINAAFLTSHASPPVSHIVVGKVRPAIRSNQVRIFIHPPTNFEEVAVLNSSIKRSSVNEDQKKMDKLLEFLKADAAKLGANGVLIQNMGDQIAGGSSSGFILGRVVMAHEDSVVYKSAAAMAIFVPEQDKVSFEETYPGLASNNPHKVMRALKELRNTNSTTAVEQVLTCLKNSDEHVLRDACRTLAVIGSKENALAIEPLLKDRRTDVISDACKALAAIGNKDSIPAIEALLKDERASVIGDACIALAAIGNEDNISAIEPLLNDKRMSVKKAAKAAIEQLHNK